MAKALDINLYVMFFTVPPPASWLEYIRLKELAEAAEGIATCKST